MVTVVVKGRRGSRTIEAGPRNRNDDDPRKKALSVLAKHAHAYDDAIFYAAGRMKAHPHGSPTSKYWFRVWQTLIRMKSGVDPRDSRAKPHLYGKMTKNGGDREAPALVVPEPPTT